MMAMVIRMSVIKILIMMLINDHGHDDDDQ